MTTLPLAGITVVSLEHAVAAPYATRQLADLGARVIKVERPQLGDFARAYDETVHGMSSYFVWLNRSKESLSLDIKSSEGRSILHRLLEDADVLVNNLAPGAMSRLGLDPDSVARSHPGLITCTITGYGSEGPWASRKAYDLLVQSESGLLSITGTDQTPVRTGISIADISAGMFAYSGVLTALLRKQGTGEISHIEVSLFDALSEWLAAPYLYTRYGGEAPRRTAAAHSTIAPYGRYDTADGAVVLAVQSEREWISFCTEVLVDPEMAVDVRFDRNSARVRNRAELDERINQHIAGRSATELVEQLDRANIASARIREIQDLADHPVLRERDRWLWTETPHGRVEVLAPPAVLRGVEPSTGPVPGLGQHTGPILEALGYRPEDVSALMAQGTV